MFGHTKIKSCWIVRCTPSQRPKAQSCDVQWNYALYTVHCTLYSLHSIYALWIVQQNCKVHSVQCTVNTLSGRRCWCLVQRISGAYLDYRTACTDRSSLVQTRLVCITPVQCKYCGVLGLASVAWCLLRTYSLAFRELVTDISIVSVEETEKMEIYQKWPQGNPISTSNWYC